MGKTGENTSMATEESHKQNRSDRWSKERRQEQKHQKYKGRVVLWGDKAKDDHALTQYVCAEQGSSVSQMTAAKVMDVKARLPGCAASAPLGDGETCLRRAQSQGRLSWRLVAILTGKSSIALGKGANHQSNHLVASFLHSFPQDDSFIR